MKKPPRIWILKKEQIVPPVFFMLNGVYAWAEDPLLPSKRYILVQHYFNMN